MVKNLPAMQETRFDPWVGKMPWRREWQPTPVFLENPMGRGESLGRGESHGRGESPVFLENPMGRGA